MNIDPNILIAIVGTAIGVLFLFSLGLIIVRRVGRRKFGPRSGQPSAPSTSSCSGNCGCKCSPPPAPGCIPALTHGAPYAHPVALNGLSINPNDPSFAYAGDVQAFVDAANRQKEAQRQAMSLDRMEETFRWMRSQATPAAAPFAPSNKKASS